MGHGVFVFCQVECARSGRSERPGTGLKKKSVGEVRIELGRNAQTSFVMVDAQSVKNTDTAEEKGYDAGKKVSGIKRHIAVDTRACPTPWP